MATGNFVSLFGAKQVNGYFLITNPSTFYQDCNVSNLIRVQMGILNGVTGFFIVYQEPMKEVGTTYFLPTNPSLLTLSDFALGLTALNSSKNTFTHYTGLIKTSNQPAQYFYGKASQFLEMLINDDYAKRSYSAKQNFTRIYVNNFNTAVQFYADFTNDQDYAGGYYYFTNTGNIYY